MSATNPVNGVSADVIDLNGMTEALESIVLCQVGAPGTVQGVFIDIFHRQIGGTAYSGVVGTVPLTLGSALGFGTGALPNGAVGFIGRLTGGDVMIGYGANAGTIPAAISADMIANGQAAYWRYYDGNVPSNGANLQLGRSG